MWGTPVSKISCNWRLRRQIGFGSLASLCVLGSSYLALYEPGRRQHYISFIASPSILSRLHASICEPWNVSACMTKSGPPEEYPI